MILFPYLRSNEQGRKSQRKVNEKCWRSEGNSEEKERVPSQRDNKTDVVVFGKPIRKNLLFIYPTENYTDDDPRERVRF